MSNPATVICTKNEGYESSLELRKVYRCIAEPASGSLSMLRVVDESGEDYLYPEEMFATIELPPELMRLLFRER